MVQICIYMTNRTVFSYSKGSEICLYLIRQVKNVRIKIWHFMEIRALMMTIITSTTTLLLLFSSTSASVCIQTTNTFPLQCPMVLRFEVLTVVLLRIQVCWDILSCWTVTVSQTSWIFILFPHWMFENLLTYNKILTSCTMFTRDTHCPNLCIIPFEMHLL